MGNDLGEPFEFVSKKMPEKIIPQPIPTNIISGFLGVGKSTLIMQLLARKPVQERWAVLVNEFGEVGVDGSLFEGQSGNSRKPAGQEAITIREVPGGCMCCASGLPMQIALNQLIAKAKPHRLIIEPTGLGHPQEVVEALSAPHYNDIIALEQCVTLVDARKIEDARYAEHPTFIQQIAIADQIVGHKADAYDTRHQGILRNYLAVHNKATTPLMFASHGDIPLSILRGVSSSVAGQSRHEHSAKACLSSATATGNTPEDVAVHAEEQPKPQKLEEGEYLKFENRGEGYRSVGWRFADNIMFSRRALFAWFTGLEVERAKGVFHTDEGWFNFNFSDNSLVEIPLSSLRESKVECIGQHLPPTLEQTLLQCVQANTK